LFSRHLATISVIFLLFLILFGCADDRGVVKKRARALENLGNALIRQGNVRAGLERLQKAERLDPENVDIHHELALAYRDLGEYDLSLKHFRRALELTPEAPEIQNNLATLYLLFGKWDPAIESCRKALGNILYKTPHFAYNNMGLAYSGKADYPEAIDAFRKALLSQSAFSPAYANLGRAYEAVSRWEKAVESYEKALYYQPNDTSARFNLGRLYFKLNRRKEAADEFYRVMESDPGGIYGEQAKQFIKKHQLIGRQ